MPCASKTQFARRSFKPSQFACWRYTLEYQWENQTTGPTCAWTWILRGLFVSTIKSSLWRDEAILLRFYLFANGLQTVRENCHSTNILCHRCVNFHLIKIVVVRFVFCLWFQNLRTPLVNDLEAGGLVVFLDGKSDARNAARRISI